MEEALIEFLKKKYSEMSSDEDLFLPEEKLEASYTLFRQRFGPEVLKDLRGETLLEKIHGRGGNNSLVYWLEFKNDIEFSTTSFGGIGGGSALKFGLYKSKTGKWMGGSPQSQKELSDSEAASLAEKQRAEILSGYQVLAGFTSVGADSDYERLQASLKESCPTLSDAAWAHKYFSLLFPELMPDIHTESLQRFQLVRLRQVPPAVPGRYTCSGSFVRLARGLGIRMNHLTALLFAMHGDEHAYWRVGTRSGETGESQWDAMKETGCVAVGWRALPDLSHIHYQREDKEWLREQVRLHYPTTPQAEGRAAQEIFNFVAAIKEGDVVVAADGQTVLGIGNVKGGYFFEPDAVFPHRRPVEWLSLDEWKMPDKEGLRTTIMRLRKNPLNLIAVEERIGGAALPRGPVPGPKAATLQGTLAEVQAILQRKGQAILYGPPGTGKTYWALRTAQEMASLGWFHKSYADLSPGEKAQVDGTPKSEGAVRTCCFHPGYGYEDFLEGFRPLSNQSGGIGFELKEGIFLRACKDALENGGRPLILVIDEINRGDVPRIFGELMLCLEKDKRDKQQVTLPLSRLVFSVPKNLFLIGTMNTADRSISLLDKALRRRFGFFELMPDISLLGGTVIEGIPLGPWLRELNKRILANVGRDARNLQVGHAYFMEEGKPIKVWARFAQVLQQDVIPLLEEYCYEDYAAMAKILGRTLVKEEHQRVLHELFQPERRGELIEAVRTVGGEELITSAAAIEDGARQEAVVEAEEDDEG